MGHEMEVEKMDAFSTAQGPLRLLFCNTNSFHFDPSLIGSVRGISSPKSQERKSSKYVRNITIKYPFSPQIFYQLPYVVNIKLSSKQKASYIRKRAGRLC